MPQENLKWQRFVGWLYMYLKTGAWVLEAGHDRRGYPAWVGQDEGQEKVGVDLVSETAHFSGK